MATLPKNLLLLREAVRQTFKLIGNLTFLKVSVLAILAFVLLKKDFSFTLELGNDQLTNVKSDLSSRAEASIFTIQTLPVVNQSPNENSIPAVVKSAEGNMANAATATGKGLTKAQKELAKKLSNLTILLSPDYFTRKNIDPAIVVYKKAKIKTYVSRFSKVAQTEAEKFNIPAAITLAQGLLESNAGDSRLASRDNNHFGIKCRKKCLGCRCANYADDSKYDMFRIYDSAWESFRSHSKLLSAGRYKHLSKLKITDYKGWANGLQKAGYATDKKYAKKLISIIEQTELYKLDQ